jgi:hypothetical protein
MNTDDDDLAVVNSKLGEIAAASSTSPPWHDAWMRLSAESSEEDRLAVFQAIRDSGYLSDEEGFYLVSWYIETMADSEVATKLQDLDNRMTAIEEAYESEEGKRWPDGQAPPEYEELSRQYQDVWDEIYVRKLEAYGEQEMADLYRTDSDEFARRYDVGLQYFQPPAEAASKVSPDDLVKVASCLDLPRANLAQMALAREEIPTALGNANFLYWSWDHSNAVGGVTIHVRRGDAKRARKALAVARAKPSESLRPWTCSSCGQRIAGRWDACWRCGHLTDGTLVSLPSEASAVQTEDDADAGIWLNVPRFFTVVAVVALVRLLCKYGWKPPLILAPCVVVLIFLLRQFEPSSSRESQPQGSAEPSDQLSLSHSIARSEVSKAIVRRAWQAAVIAALTFPPLGFYSMRLLWKLGQRDTPLSWADRWRCWTAFFLNIATIFYCLAFAYVLLLAF